MTITIHYLGIRFTKETNRLINKFIAINDIIVDKPPNHGLHTTIIYSRKPFEYKLGSLPKNPIGNVGFCVDLYNLQLVLPFNSQYLSMINEIVIRSGAISDFPTYKPHITIAENYTRSLNTIKNTFDIPLVLSEIYYREWDIDLERLPNESRK
jgi:hypothetical protein